ncbi:MAG: TolC family protein [Bacteroidota bacterium]
MTHTLLTLFGVLSGFMLSSQSMSLEECIQYALEHQNSIQNARFDEYIAEKRVGEILSSGLPQIEGQASVQNNFALPVFVLPGPDGGVSEVTFGLPWQAAIGASANQLVFDGTFFLGVRAAKVYVDISQKNLNRTQEEIAYRVSQAYYQALSANNQRDLLQTNLNRVDKLWKETLILFENGFAEKIDAERLEINHNSLEIQLSRVERLVETSLDLLKFQMGMSVNEPLSLIQENENNRSLAVPELEAVTEFDLSQRVEYQILQTQKELENYNMRRYRVGHMPSLYAFANYSWNTQWDFQIDSLDVRYTNGAVGLQLNIPIFDGFRKSRLAQQSQLAIKKIDNDLEDFENATRMELTNSHRSYLNAYQSLESLEKNQALAQKVFNIATTKYKEGVGSSLELNDAENTLKEAEAQYISGLFEYYLARLDWQKARGELSKYHRE